MNPPTEDPGETERLQRCLSDLGRLLAEPASLHGDVGVEGIRAFAELVRDLLRLDFTYVRLNSTAAEPPFEVAAFSASEQSAPLPSELGSSFEPWFETDPGAWPARVRNPLGNAEISVAAASLGARAELGVIVAGSSRASFPNDFERLLLGVAARQASVSLLAAANAALKSELGERTRELEALRARELDARLVINTLPVTAWSTLPDGYCDFVSRRWLDYAGFSWEQAEGWGWSTVIHPDDTPALVEHWRSRLASGAPVDVEARMRRADGVYRWFLFRANPLRDESGAIVKWYGTNIDIEDRKLAQEELRQSERDARLIVECIPAQVSVLGPTGAVVRMNRRVAEFFGRSPEEMTAWRTSDLVPPDELPRVRAGMARSLETGEPFEMENRLRRFDGVYRWSQVRGLPQLDESGRPVRWYFVVTDIEHRKQAEEALRRSEAVLSEAQRISLTGSFSWRPDTDDVVFSEELCRMLELAEGEPVTLDQIALRVHPDDVWRLRESMNHVRGNGGQVEYEMRLRTQKGGLKYLHTSVRQIRARDDRQEVVGVIQDISQRRIAEDALSRTRSELAEMTRVASLGALTASIAHEVNQPLSGIAINANTCLRLLAAESPDVEGALNTVRRILRDGNRATEVITRLRELFIKRTGATEPVDLNEATREVLSLSINELQRNEVVLRTELAGDLPEARGDRIQLQQVILNLVLNASQAMIGIQERPRQLVVKTERGSGETAVFSVRDAGVGLQGADGDRLFQPFYTTKQSGMGIGLAVSRSIVERHGGRLWAAANGDGPGTTVSFSIPLVSTH